MALTAKEVAGIIGVSQATLSLVINNKPGISDRTRNKVLRELRARGYEYLINEEAFAASEDNPSISDVANISAESSGTIGFVNYQVGGELLGVDSFFPLIITGIEAAASENGYNVSFINIERSRIAEGIKQLIASGCSGYVIFATELKEQDLTPFIQLRIPFVILDNYFCG